MSEGADSVVLPIRNTRKACACVLRGHSVLVFRHPLVGDFQLPKGTIEVSETPVDAVLRELTEESGLNYQGMPVLLGELTRELRMPPMHERQHWFVYVMPMYGITLPQTWIHRAVGSEDEDGLLFDFFWHDLRADTTGFEAIYVDIFSRLSMWLAHAESTTTRGV